MKKKIKFPNKSKAKMNEKINRKEALMKVGKYTVYTAAAMLTVLSPKESQAESPPPVGW